MYFSLIFFLMIMVPPVTVLMGIKKQKSPYATIYASIVAVSFGVIVVLAMARYTGPALGEQFLNGARQIAETIASSEELASKAGLSNLTYNERVNLIIRLYASISTMLPTVVIVGTALFTYLMYMFSSRAFKKIGQNPPELVPLKFFSWPPSLFFGYLLLSILAILVELTEPFATANIYMNVSVIFEYALAVQGFGVVLLFFDVKRVPKIVGAIVGATGVMTGLGRMILFVIGMFDYLFNFRGRATRK